MASARGLPYPLVGLSGPANRPSLGCPSCWEIGDCLRRQTGELVSQPSRSAAKNRLLAALPARIVNVCWHAARRSSCALPMCDRQRRAARQVRGGPSRVVCGTNKAGTVELYFLLLYPRG